MRLPRVPVSICTNGGGSSVLILKASLEAQAAAPSGPSEDCDGEGQKWYRAMVENGAVLSAWLPVLIHALIGPESMPGRRGRPGASHWHPVLVLLQGPG